MRTNKSGITEVASLRTNLDAYGENYERIFGKKCKCEKDEDEVCEDCENKEKDEK